MRVISLWEPWASLMAMGAKRIETRDWKTAVRGEVAIHAAKRPFHPAQWPLELGAWLERVGMKTWGYGCVVAVGQLIDCVPVEQIRDTLSPQERAFGDFSAGRFAWVFSDVRRLDAPVHAKGAQGFWNWEGCKNLQESRVISDEKFVNHGEKVLASLLPTNIDEPPDLPPREPPDEPPVVDYGYTHRQESGADYSGNYSNPPATPITQSFVEAFNAGAQDGASLASGKGEIPWMDGAMIAWEVMTLLDDLCSRISIGGSLRRSKPVVGDIEILCQPRDPAVFARRCELLLERGRFALRLNQYGGRIAFAPRYRAVTFRAWDNTPPMPLDLFIVQPDRQWGPTALIRTGPNAANQMLVTQAGQRTTLGDRGILPPNMKFEDGQIWRDDLPLDCPEEKHVFAACGLTWVSPWLRSAAYYEQMSRRVWESVRVDGVKPGVGQPLIGDDGPRKEWGWARSPAGKWYRLEAAELLRRRPALVSEIESLRIAGEVAKQVELL